MCNGMPDLRTAIAGIQAGSYAMMGAACAAFGLPLRQTFPILGTVIASSTRHDSGPGIGLRASGMDQGPTVADGIPNRLFPGKGATCMPCRPVRAGVRVRPITRNGRKPVENPCHRAAPNTLRRSAEATPLRDLFHANPGPGFHLSGKGIFLCRRAECFTGGARRRASWNEPMTGATYVFPGFHHIINVPTPEYRLDAGCRRGISPPA